MVQEYKNTDLDLFQKIDLTNPKDELLKKNKICLLYTSDAADES